VEEVGTYVATTLTSPAPLRVRDAVVALTVVIVALPLLTAKITV
jgi:hypothetical protein